MNYIKLLIQSLYNRCITINLYNMQNSYIILFCICFFVFHAIKDSGMKRPSNRYRTSNNKRFYDHDSGKSAFLTKKLHNSFLEVTIKSLFLSFLTLSHPHTEAQIFMPTVGKTYLITFSDLEPVCHSPILFTIFYLYEVLTASYLYTLLLYPTFFQVSEKTVLKYFRSGLERFTAKSYCSKHTVL